MNKIQDGITLRQRRALRDLADSFVMLDHTCLLGIQSFFQQETMPVSKLPNGKTDVGQRLRSLNAIIAGDLEFRVKYLTDLDDTMKDYWDSARRLIILGLNEKKMLTYGKARDASMKMIWSIDDAASDTERYIVKALRAKQLNDATQEALRMRWYYLDLIHDAFSQGHTHTQRGSSS